LVKNLASFILEAVTESLTEKFAIIAIDSVFLVIGIADR